MTLPGVVALAGTVSGGPIRLDMSAVDPFSSGYPVSERGAQLCGPGAAEDGTVLAVAIVTYGRRPGRSTWGHSSLRFISCEAGLLRDVEYEYYRMDASIERWLRALYGREAWTGDEAYLRAQHGQLVVVRNERPADGGFFAAELNKNREIIEAWMPWSDTIRTQLYASLEERYASQLRSLRGLQDLDGYRYEAMGTNCTLHVREALAYATGGTERLVGSVFPMRNLTWLEGQEGVRFVMHPSPDVLRRELDGKDLPRAVSELPRGILRRRLSPRQEAVVARSLPGATSVIIEWLLESEEAE